MAHTAPAAAQDRGFTRLIEASNGALDLTLWVSPRTDLDDRFDAVCDDTGDVLSVNGWLLMIEG